MNPQINGPIEEEKKNQVNDSCYSGSNSRFLKQIFHVITHLKFISASIRCGRLRGTDLGQPMSLERSNNARYRTCACRHLNTIVRQFLPIIFPYRFMLSEKHGNI
jgi:hypothetical protein